MIRIPKSIASLGVLALGAGALILVVPRAAHAVAVALVQVTNTAAAPAITQDVSKLASQNVELACNTPAVIPIQQTSVETNCVQVFPDGSVGGTPFVASGGRLIITTVAFNVTGVDKPLLAEQGSGSLTARASWSLNGAGSYQFQYPSGIVIAQGSTLSVVFNDVIVGGSASLYGYISAN